MIVPSKTGVFCVSRPGTGRGCDRFVKGRLMGVAQEVFPLSRGGRSAFVTKLSVKKCNTVQGNLGCRSAFKCVTNLSSTVVLRGVKATSSDSPVFFRGGDFLRDMFKSLSQVGSYRVGPR